MQVAEKGGNKYQRIPTFFFKGALYLAIEGTAKCVIISCVHSG